MEVVRKKNYDIKKFDELDLGDTFILAHEIDNNNVYIKIRPSEVLSLNDAEIDHFMDYTECIIVKCKLVYEIDGIKEI